MNKEELLLQVAEGIDKLLEDVKVVKEVPTTSKLEASLRRLWVDKEMHRSQKVELVCYLLEKEFGG